MIFKRVAFLMNSIEKWQTFQNKNIQIIKDNVKRKQKTSQSMCFKWGEKSKTRHVIIKIFNDSENFVKDGKFLAIITSCFFTLLSNNVCDNNHLKYTLVKS